MRTEFIDAVFPLRNDGSRTLRLSHGGHVHATREMLTFEPVAGDFIVIDDDGRIFLMPKIRVPQRYTFTAPASG